MMNASFNHLMHQLLRFLRLDVREGERERPPGYKYLKLEQAYQFLPILSSSTLY
jgi:hypothetical protein